VRKLISRGDRFEKSLDGETRFAATFTFSVAKSYLSVLAGVAVDRGLIRDIDEPVHAYGLDDGFDSAQNRAVTWRHLLQQTSEWQGTLWGKPDSIDHNRNLGQSDLGFTDKGTPRPMRSQSSSTRSTPMRRASAMRWITALVEPPTAITTAIAFSKALRVMICRGSN